MSDQPSKAENLSPDNANFCMIPRVVWAHARTPYDLSYWLMVKDIAGEKGQCILSTQQQATYAMMSVGQVTDCRTYWLEIGLLEGEVKRDPYYPQAVWHLYIPQDIWIRNSTFAFDVRTIKQRLEFKTTQAAEIKGKRTKKEPSPGETSREPSPGETSYTPGETSYTPGETNKILKDLNKEIIIDPMNLVIDAKRILHQALQDYPLLLNHLTDYANYEAIIDDEDGLCGITVSKIGKNNAEFLTDRATQTAERALIGIVGHPVAVTFME